MDAAAAVATAARIIIAGDIRDTQIVTGIHGQGCGGDLKPYTENPGDISGVEAVLVVFAPALGLFIRGHQVAELGACFQEEAGKMSIFQQDGKIDIVFMLCYGDIADIGFKPLTGIYQFRLNSKTVTERQPNIKAAIKAGQRAGADAIQTVAADIGKICTCFYPECELGVSGCEGDTCQD